jgi:hypothetical protein
MHHTAAIGRFLMRLSLSTQLTEPCYLHVPATGHPTLYPRTIIHWGFLIR